MAFLTKIKKVLKKPRFAVNYLFNSVENLFLKRYRWSEYESNFKKKKYESYSEYIVHQKSKLDRIKGMLNMEYHERYHRELKKRLENQGVVRADMNVLCLAARIGTEVKAFLDIGCFAIGLDLNPGEQNSFVVCGDFHDIQFPDNCVDVVFTNSLDHSFDLKQLINEIRRVLKPGGHLIIEIQRGTEEGYTAGYYESIVWKKIDDLLDIFTVSGFKVVKCDEFEYPWIGRHYSLAIESK